MSHNTFADFVPYVAHCVIRCRNLDDNDVDMVSLCSPETRSLGEGDWQTNPEPNFFHKNWVYNGSNQPYPGKKQNLIANMFVKNDKKVFVINESPYSNGGDYEISIVGEVPGDILEFLGDWNLSGSVESEDIVYCSY
jgi:hypothetical protein